jgi:hypothetical protein
LPKHGAVPLNRRRADCAVACLFFKPIPLLKARISRSIHAICPAFRFPRTAITKTFWSIILSRFWPVTQLVTRDENWQIRRWGTGRNTHLP